MEKGEISETGTWRNGHFMNETKSLKDYTPEMQKKIKKTLRRRARRRKLVKASCVLIALGCFAYLIGYNYFGDRTDASYDTLKELKDKGAQKASSPSSTTIHYTEEGEIPDILPEYQDLYNTNKSLIGWVKIEDTNIDYPVMQTSNNEYYLTHNLSQDYDRNGSIFMDTACDVLKPSMNFIIYGHDMSSGKMFGQLDKYKEKSYWEKHPVIQFDTIYQKGTYEIVYVFHSKVYNADEITFKYYQFIDANSQEEFDSYMNSMNGLSLYDTGVPVVYGDQFLTLSTCDRATEENGRFVVVAKRVE